MCSFAFCPKYFVLCSLPPQPQCFFFSFCVYHPNSFFGRVEQEPGRLKVFDIKDQRSKKKKSVSSILPTIILQKTSYIFLFLFCWENVKNNAMQLFWNTILILAMVWIKIISQGTGSWKVLWKHCGLVLFLIYICVLLFFFFFFFKSHILELLIDLEQSLVNMASSTLLQREVVLNSDPVWISISPLYWILTGTLSGLLWFGETC